MQENTLQIFTHDSPATPTLSVSPSLKHLPIISLQTKHKDNPNTHVMKYLYPHYIPNLKLIKSTKFIPKYKMTYPMCLLDF